MFVLTSRITVIFESDLKERFTKFRFANHYWQMTAATQVLERCYYSCEGKR